MSEADITKVIEAFEEAGSRWALVGAHAVGLLTEPRATVDFDFIVETARLQKILGALEARFGELGQEDVDAAVRLRNIDVDLIRSTNHPLFMRALELTRRIDAWQVPRAEVILALKFLAAVSPWRNEAKRTHDVGDMRSIYQALGTDGIDRALLLELGGLAYPGAQNELEQMLDKFDRGEPIQI
ncbi:MAG: hypothetical protein A2138_02330 [Deltaproteobacteria bacterium RBG_16_71_12]|nr:MAG: hypothetical protein A2138_02330 [Deltaproteobacteria bacterium RBG_16_71_12]